MPYIGNIVQDFSVNNAMLNTDSVTSIKIDDGTIVNADINDSAAIAGTKISPDFGSQNIVTTGQITIGGTLPTLNFTDSDNNSDFMIKNHNGSFEFRDTTNGSSRIQIASDGTIDLNGNVDCNSGLDVTGAITGTGDLTIDTNTLHVDSSNNRVGIGTTSPSHSLHVVSNGTDTALFKGRIIKFDGAAASDSPRLNFSLDGTDKAQILLHRTTDEIDIETMTAKSIKFKINSVEKMRIDASGRVLIGHTAVTPVDNDANNPHFQFQGTGGDDSRISIRHNSTTASNAASIYLSRSRGTSNGAKTSVAENDALGNLIFMGADGTHDTRAAIIQASCDGTPGDNDMPGRLEFLTTPDGALNATEKMRINATGNVGIGATNPAGKLHISSGTSGDCELIIEADTDNNDENDNARIVFRQDGGSAQSSIGTQSNELVLANSVSTSGGIVFKTGTTSPHTNATERMRIHPGTNQVQIGGTTLINSSPYLTLGQSANSQGDVFHLINNGTADLKQVFISANKNSRHIGIDVSTDNFFIGRDSSDIDLTISNNGKVGIGTASPEEELTIASANPCLRLNDTDNYHRVVSSGEQLTLECDTGNERSGSYIAFRVDGAVDRCRVTQYGLTPNPTDTAEANALDDYEEGSLNWELAKSGTPSLGSNNGSSVKYVKVGRLVHISGRVRTDSTGSASDDNFVFQSGSTLPFTPETSGTSVIGHFRSQDKVGSDLTASIAWTAGSTTLYLYTIDSRGDYSADSNNVPVSNQTNLVITFSLTYRANA